MPQAIPASLSPKEAATAIMALINSSPRSPRQDEIEAVIDRIGQPAPSQAVPVSDLRIRLRKAMEKADAALDASCRLLHGSERTAAEAELAMWGDEIAAMEKEIPNPPTCFEDLVARAEVARYGGDIVDGKLMEAEDEENVFLGPAGRLIEAVLKFAKAVAGSTSMASMSPAHAAHFREWRGLIDQHMREFEEKAGMTRDQVEAEERRMGAHMEIIDGIADKILNEPVQMWGDLLTCAEVIFWYKWAGIDAHGPHARGQMDAGPMSCGEAIDQAITKLLKNIFSLAGVGQFASEARS